MNTLIHHKKLLAVAVACALLSACAGSPSKSDSVVSLRNRLTQLQSDPRLGDKAPFAMKEAEAAVAKTEQPGSNKALTAHLIFMAGRKIDIAQAQAENNYALASRNGLNEQREAMRLQSRTKEADAANMRAASANMDARNQQREADLARSQAELARADAVNQRQSADSARDAADVARNEADAQRAANEAEQRNSAELQRQIDGLQAKVTDRGLVLTLGDVLFASGTANLNAGGNTHLSRLAEFLKKYPERNAVIEGHTDSVGSESYNQALSQRRADAVKAYLATNGVDPSRIAATGKGEDSPIGDNATATGRQQNRRVEVIITNNQVAQR